MPSDFETKYKQNIAGIAKTNNVDLGVAKDMLISNLTKGGQYKGGGILDYNAATPDANAYIDQARQQAIANLPNKTTAAQSAQPDYQGKINSLYDATQKYRMAQLEASRNKALGQTNLQEQQGKQQYQTMRNQNDVGIEAGKQKLREMMASQGLLSSGDNNTEMTNLRIARENQQGNINLQQQQFLNMLQQRRADIMDPAQEQAILGEVDAQRNQAMLNELYQADQRNFRNKEFDYRAGRDAIGDQRYNTELDYRKGRDQVSDQHFDKTYGLSERQAIGALTGIDPVTGQSTADQAYRLQQLADARAARQASAAAAATRSQASSQATSAKQQSAQITAAAIAEAMTYPNYDTAMGSLQYHAPELAAQGVDVEAVLDAINKRFGSAASKNPQYIE